jgi:hypothetical protein
MSQDHEARRKLTRLADAVMQDILETSDADILAEVDCKDLGEARTILLEIKVNVSKRLLSSAKVQHEAWRSSRSRSVISFNSSAARERFDSVRRGDPEFNQKITLAARKGKTPSDTDIEGIADDWEDLQSLDGESSTE